MQRIRERVSGVQYFLEHHCGLFYFLTNAPLDANKELCGKDYYLARCRVEDVQSANWQVRFLRINFLKWNPRCYIYNVL